MCSIPVQQEARDRVMTRTTLLVMACKDPIMSGKDSDALTPPCVKKLYLHSSRSATHVDVDGRRKRAQAHFKAARGQIVAA
jgi:hypothetical protein